MSDRPVTPASTPLSGGQAPSQARDVSVAGLLNQVALAQAADLARAGHYAAAEGLLRDRLQEVAEDGASAAVYDLLARICAQRGRFEEAEALWKQAQQIAGSSEAYDPALRRAARMKRSPSWARFLRPFLWPALGVLVLAGLVVSVVWIASRQPAGKELALVAAVEGALSADDELSTLDLDVRQVGSVLYLDGTVPAWALKARAEALAKAVDGVEAVDASGVAVEPPPIAAAVQDALAAHADTATLDLVVEQVNGGVRLSGHVTSVADKDLAVGVARAVDGVGLVDAAGIAVVPPPLAEMVELQLRGDSRLAQHSIAVEQVGNGVRLSGSVHSAGEKENAERLAAGVEGVGLVDSSGLTIVPPPLADAVRQALADDERTAGLDIAVEQLDNGVRLEGTVPSLAVKEAVESVVHGVPGVGLVDAGAVLVEPPFVEYVVRRGDTLTSIAKQFYGDADLWPLILDANRDEIEDPSLIAPGMVLVIPVVR